MNAKTFLVPETLLIIILGLIAFMGGTGIRRIGSPYYE
jgi:Na+-transporting methylmalonyl-CoA/oxaloacetate decarboxylase beta subunit